MGKLPERIYRKIYLPEWMDVLGVKQSELANGTEVDQSYISNMCKGRRPNPSAHVLFAISEYLGITVNDLYRPPPSASSLAPLRELSPAARSAVLAARTRK